MKTTTNTEAMSDIKYKSEAYTPTWAKELQHYVIVTPDLCIQDLVTYDQSMEVVAALITTTLPALGFDKLSKVSWVNIPDKDKNPGGTIGHFRVHVYKKKQTIN